MTIPLQIGHLSFKTKKDAKEYFRAILNRQNWGQSIVDNDFHDLIALLTNHPSAAKKMGTGIKRIFVAPNAWGDRCFHIERTDYTHDNFSYIKCIDGNNNQYSDFSEACRHAVAHVIVEFKSRFFNNRHNEPILCPITKQGVTFASSQVDHKPPMTFSVIVTTFINKEHIVLSDVQYDEQADYGKHFADSTLARCFIDWHQANAILRIVSAQGNAKTSGIARIR